MWNPLLLCCVVGIVLVAASFASPFILPNDDSADLVTRQTARVAILFWGAAAGALLVRRRDWGRAAWTVGCLTFLIHVATAFDRVHGWSHLAAFRHVESVSGFGPGLLVSYAFTLIWVADAIWWWTDRRGYDMRPTWLDWSVHIFFAFMVFNGTVVFETGFIRWAGIILFVFLGVVFARARLRQL